MGKVDNFVRFARKDYPDAPEWFDKHSKNLNHILEQITGVLQAGVSTENENAEVLNLSLFDGATQEIQAPSVDGEIEEVRVMWAETAISSFTWSRTADGAYITVYFSGSPTDQRMISLKVRGA